MSLSVLIPTCDDEAGLQVLLDRLTQAEVTEVVVADAGSVDGTVAVARQFGAHLCRAPGASEGRRFAAAAGIAQGEALWCLHPGCRPPPDGASRILDTLEEEDVVGGAFRTVREGSSLLRQTGDTLVGVLAGPSVETGLFARTEAATMAGGFPDHDHPLPTLHRALRQVGRLAHIRGSIVLPPNPPPAGQP